MMGGKQEKGHSNPAANYLRMLYSHKNFFISTFKNYFFGRYKNTYLGVLWHFITPAMYFILCYIMATEIRGRDSEYVVLLGSGIFIYNILVNSISGSGGIFTSGANMIKKMNFPREMLIYVRVLVDLVVTLVLYAILAIVIICLGIGFNGWALLWFPVYLVLALVFAIGCDLIFASITVYVRDVQVFLASISMVFFILSPLRSMVSEITGVRATIVMYNPMTYFMEPMHYIFYMKEVPDLYWLGMATALALGALLLGVGVYRVLKKGLVERL